MNRKQKRTLAKAAARTAVAYTRKKYEGRSTRSEAYVSARAVKLQLTKEQYEEVGKVFVEPVV
jgi:hypothetical protein